jgi:hypothetical protein
MPKKMRDGLTEEECKQRNDLLHIINVNLSFCYYKRDNFKDSIKHANEAIAIDN